MNGIANGYDGYILENNSIAFYYVAQGEYEEMASMFKILPLPNSKIVADIIKFGAVNEDFFLVFADSIYSIWVGEASP